MKKLLAILLALAMVLSLAACGSNDTPDTPDNPDGTVGDGTANDNNTVDPDTADDAVDAPVEAVDVAPADILNEIWNSVEGEKPMVFGGDYSNGDQFDNVAGEHVIGDGSELDSNFGYPSSMIDKISEAAALRHMINVNLLSVGAYKLNDSADAQRVCDQIVSNLMNRSYLCGAPQWLTVIKVYDNYVVNVFGADDLVAAFKDAAVKCYGDNAVILHDETMEGAHGDNGIALGDFGIALG